MYTNEQRILTGVVETVAAGASVIVPVTGTRGTVVYSNGGTATILPCTADGTAALGKAATAVTLGALNEALSTHQKITAAVAACQVHLV